MCKSKKKWNIGVCTFSLPVMHIFQLHVWPKCPDYLRNLFVIACLLKTYKNTTQNILTVCLFVIHSEILSILLQAQEELPSSLLHVFEFFLVLMKNLNVQSQMSYNYLLGSYILKKCHEMKIILVLWRREFWQCELKVWIYSLLCGRTYLCHHPILSSLS